MPTDEMLIDRFTEIMNLTMMQEGEVETACELKIGGGDANGYRLGYIISICKTSIKELEQSIADRQANRQKEHTNKHYKGVAAGDIPSMDLP